MKQIARVVFNRKFTFKHRRLWVLPYNPKPLWYYSVFHIRNCLFRCSGYFFVSSGKLKLSCQFCRSFKYKVFLALYPLVVLLQVPYCSLVSSVCWKGVTESYHTWWSQSLVASYNYGATREVLNFKWGLLWSWQPAEDIGHREYCPTYS